MTSAHQEDGQGTQAGQSIQAGKPVAARPLPPEPVLPEQSREDTDVAWGDYPSRDDADRLYRDRPPHWADY
jgi:hypothetical protein